MACKRAFIIGLLKINQRKGGFPYTIYTFGHLSSHKI